MAWIPLYLVGKDVEILNDWFNKEGEIAFLVANGAGKWIAKNEHAFITGKSATDFTSSMMWHIPSGPLPLIDHETPDRFVSDPWTGWTEITQGANAKLPYFGAGHPGIFKLDINITESGEIPISGLQWIGNHYRIIGNGAMKSTELFWSKLRRMIKKNSTQIPRANNKNDKNEVFAFPCACTEIKNGRLCSFN